MPALVVDASVTLAWALPDESSEYAETVLTVVELEGMHVTDLWAREVANGLAIAFTRRRLNAEAEQLFLTSLERLVINVDRSFDPVSVIREGVAIALRSGLTAYDAAYVELAARKRLMLATLDKQMLSAARSTGVAVFDSYSGLKS